MDPKSCGVCVGGVSMPRLLPSSSLGTVLSQSSGRNAGGKSSISRQVQAEELVNKSQRKDQGDHRVGGAIFFNARIFNQQM